MKKLISFVLLLAICFSLGACSSNTKVSKETIEITADNFQDYFFIEIETNNYEVKSGNLIGTYYEDGYADCNLRIGQKVAGSLENVTITLWVNSGYWQWKLDEPMEFFLNIPLDGNLKKTIPFETRIYSAPGMIDEPEFYFVVVAASGTIEIEK